MKDPKAIKEELLRRASLYQKDDGEPGPLGDTWGWRIIAQHLREVAQKIEA